MITHSIESGYFSSEDDQKVAELAEKFFKTKIDSSQIPSEEITYDFVSRQFPLCLNVIKDDNKIIGHTFVLPCDNQSMDEFLNKSISEKDLFHRIRDKIPLENYTSLYLVSAQIIPSYQGRGIATKSFILQIGKYEETLGKKLDLFYWSLTREGEALIKKISNKVGTQIYQRN